MSAAGCWYRPIACAPIDPTAICFSGSCERSAPLVLLSGVDRAAPFAIAGGDDFVGYRSGVTSSAQEYPAVIERTIRALIENGVEAGAGVLAPIAGQREELRRRPALSRRLLGEVYRRDRYECRYCGQRLIPASIMELVATIYPEAFPFHPNWKGGQTHPAFIACSPIVDHVVPGSLGGDWRNLVTSCWPCNSRKADFTLEQLGWSLRPVPEIGWDGLVGLYRELWRVAGQPKLRFHADWMAALGAS